jgi:hypothetical protein
LLYIRIDKITVLLVYLLVVLRSSHTIGVETVLFLARPDPVVAPWKPITLQSLPALLEEI